MGLNKQEVLDIRKDFPILHQSAYGRPLVYLDNAATTQKPQCVIDTITDYYSHTNANVHRGVHFLSARSTKAYEDARNTIQQHINAKHGEEIVFVRGTTEAINLVAQTFGKITINAGDKILVSALEHHSNLIPWQMLCQERNAEIVVAPLNENNDIDLEAFKALLNDSAIKIAAFNYISNSLGTINPVKQLVSLCKAKGVATVVDGAQALPHTQVDVQDIDCDFFAFSGHKVYGPTGTGVLYGKKALLEAMPPYQGGGDMILQVGFHSSQYNVPPYRFEAGTPNIVGPLGLASAINYIQHIGLDNISQYESALFSYLKQELKAFKKLTIHSKATNNAAVLSFTHSEAHPHDIGTILDQEGIAIRAGHHCTMPLMDLLRLNATVRASLSFYNTEAEVDALVSGLRTVEKLFQ